MTCSNEICEWAKRASASGIVIFLKIESISLYFTQISFEFPEFLNNFLLFSQIFLKFLKILEFLEKLSQISPKKEEIFLKVEALYGNIVSFFFFSLIKLWFILWQCVCWWYLSCDPNGAWRNARNRGQRSLSTCTCTITFDGIICLGEVPVVHFVAEFEWEGDLKLFKFL